jgi:hypothetical protein
LNLFCASAADFNRLFRNARYAIISLRETLNKASLSTGI